MSVNLSLADELKVFDFTETELSELQVRKVRGADNKTLYTVGKNEKGNYLKSIAENAASGYGLTKKIANDFFAKGVDVITLGNHSWDQREMLSFIEECLSLNLPKILYYPK